MSLTQKMEKYMLTNKKLIQCFAPLIKKKVFYKKEEIFNTKKREEPNKKRVKETEDIFFPEQKDSLFWCFYILKHGKDAFYELQQEINIVTERKKKIEYVELLRQNKKTIKGYKIAPLVNIENFLVNEPCIDMGTFFALCILEQIPLLYVYRKTYFELVSATTVSEENTSLTSFIVYKQNDSLRYGCQCDISYELVSHIKNTHFKMEQMNKPVRAFSAYKTNDLLDICKKLDINTLNKDGKKRSNKELYESIVQYF